MLKFALASQVYCKLVFTANIGGTEYTIDGNSIGANARTGELARRRDAVKQIMKDVGSFIDDSTIIALERLGFRYVSGSNHHKLDFAGIRFPVAKMSNDRRSCLNSASEIICDRVF